MILVFFPRKDHPDAPQGAAELVYQLRGGHVFEAMKRLGMQVKLPNDEGSIDVPTKPPLDVIVYADLGVLVDLSHPFVDYVDKYSIKLIVDVHFPFGVSEKIKAVQPGKDDETRDPSIDQRAAELWTTAAQLEKAYRILAKADVLTVPRTDWIGPLRQHVRRAQPIVVLPDITSPKAGAQFYKMFNRARAQALQIDKPGWRQPLTLLNHALMSFNIQQVLAHSQTDWESLKRGEIAPTA